MKVLNWSVFLILSCIFIYSPYHRGLFFDEDIFILETIIGVIFIFYFSLFLFKKREVIDISVFIVFIWPLLYVITIPIAETPNGNFEQLFRWTMYACFFVLLYTVRNQENVFEKIMPYIFYAVGIWISYFGMFALWDIVNFQDAILGGRMASVFQYPNTFATVIGGFLLFSFMMLTNEKQKIRDIIYFSIPLVAFWIGILHSSSRGTWIIIPIAWFVGLVMLKFQKQIIYLLYTVFSIIVSLLVYRTIMSDQALNVDKPGLSVFVVATILTVIINILIHHFLIRKDKIKILRDKKWSNWYMPISMVFLFVLLILDLIQRGFVFSNLPKGIKQRLVSIDLTNSKSFLEVSGGRTTFYEQALNMSKEAPIFGFGGEGWRLLFAKYQTIPFWARETHNGYLTLILDIGWLGAILLSSVFVFLFIVIYRRIFKDKETNNTRVILAMTPAFVLFLFHSFIDFDWSFATTWLIFMWMLVMGISQKPLFNNKFTRFGFPRIISIIVFLFVLSITIMSNRFYIAHKTVNVNAQMTINEAEVRALKASNYNPYKTDYQLSLVNIYLNIYRQSPSEDLKQTITTALENVERLEPHNPMNLAVIGGMYASLGELDKGIKYYEKAINNDPFGRDYYFALIRLKVELANVLKLSGDLKKAIDSAREAVDVYESYNKKVHTVGIKNIADFRGIALSGEAHYYAAEGFRLLGEFQKSLDSVEKAEIYREQNKELFLRAKSLQVDVLRKLGRLDEANELEQIILLIYPEFKDYLNK